MTVHFIDSVVFGDSVGTADMRQVFSERATFQRWLDVEVALAKAQASLGMIPMEAAEIIASKADADVDRPRSRQSPRETHRATAFLGFSANSGGSSRMITPATSISGRRLRTSSIRV